MNISKKILNLINKNLFILIIISIIAGLINLKITGGYNFSATICILASFIMIMPSLVPFDFKKIFKKEEEKEENFLEKIQKNNLKNTPLKFDQNNKKNFSSTKTIFLTIFLNFILYPAIAFLIATFFFPDNKQLSLGIILLSILPGGGMITTWALGSKANMTLTVKIIFYNLLFAVFFIPIFSPFLINNHKISENSEKILNLDFNKIISENNLSKNTEENTSEEIQNTQACVLSEVTGGGISCGGDSSNPLSNLLPVLFIIIIFPLFLAFIIQKLYIKFLGEKSFEKNKKYFGSFSNLGLIITLFIIMSFNTNKIIFEKPELFLKSLIPVLLFYIIIFSISFFIMKKFYKNNKKEGLAFFWGSTLRYITLILAFTSAIAISDSSYTIIIVIIIIAYLIQIPASFWFAKYFKKYFKD